MDPKNLHLGSDHVLNIMSQEQEFNIPSNSDPKTVSEPIVSDHDLNSMSQEYEISIPSTPGSTTISEVVDSDANADTSIEPPTIKRIPSCKNLLSGKKEEYMEICVPLYKAAITSDWEAAKVILDRRPELVRFAITSKGDTTLHIAVRAEATKQGEIFVENLVNMMEIKDLEIENEGGDWAYMIAAAKGNVHMFDVIVNKHKDLLSIFPEKTLEVLETSAIYGNHDMTLHLYNVLEKLELWFWGEVEWCLFFINCLYGDLFDIALKVLEDHSKIGTSINTCFASLYIFARRPDTLNTTETCTYMIWRIATSILGFFHVKKNSPEMDNQALKVLQLLLKLYPIHSDDDDDILEDLRMFIYVKEVQEMGMNNLRGLLFTAAEMGNTRFVIELDRMFPNIIIDTKDDGISILHIAIMRRHKSLYNLLYETGSHNGTLVKWADNKKNNILHLVGMTSNDSTAQLQTVSGASLLMRELLWYKEVEKMVPPLYRNSRNADSKTPYELFSENNKELVSTGLKWTKDCMVVATLIITVAFAVAFTVPGGYNQETGIPIFNHDTSFMVFIIADAFSLFTSSTSLLVFLSILTSPYGDQRDFLYAMPGKLMIGLVTLFMSVAAMMVTFAASYFVIYQYTFLWVPILISVFAATPVVTFAALQYPFLMDMFRSMYDSRYLFNTGRHSLYNKNKRL